MKFTNDEPPAGMALINDHETHGFLVVVQSNSDTREGALASAYALVHSISLSARAEAGKYWRWLLEDTWRAQDAAEHDAAANAKNYEAAIAEVARLSAWAQEIADILWPPGPIRVPSTYDDIKREVVRLIACRRSEARAEQADTQCRDTVRDVHYALDDAGAGLDHTASLVKRIATLRTKPQGEPSWDKSKPAPGYVVGPDRMGGWHWEAAGPELFDAWTGPSKDEATAIGETWLHFAYVRSLAMSGPHEPRPLHLAWNGAEWVDGRCGCRYHPDDDRGSHGGAPHVHRCEQHTAAAIHPTDPPKQAREWLENIIEEALHFVADECSTAEYGACLRLVKAIREAADDCSWPTSEEPTYARDSRGQIERLANYLNDCGAVEDEERPTVDTAVALMDGLTRAVQTLGDKGAVPLSPDGRVRCCVCEEPFEPGEAVRVDTDGSLIHDVDCDHPRLASGLKEKQAEWEREMGPDEDPRVVGYGPTSAELARMPPSEPTALSPTHDNEVCPTCGCFEHCTVAEEPTKDGQGVGKQRLCEHCDGDRPACPWSEANIAEQIGSDYRAALTFYPQLPSSLEIREGLEDHGLLNPDHEWTDLGERVALALRGRSEARFAARAAADKQSPLTEPERLVQRAARKGNRVALDAVALMEPHQRARILGERPNSDASEEDVVAALKARWARALGLEDDTMSTVELEKTTRALVEKAIKLSADVAEGLSIAHIHIAAATQVDEPEEADR